MSKTTQCFFLLLSTLCLTASTCETSSTSYGRSCEIVLETTNPASGSPDAEVELVANPLTTKEDSQIFVGGISAEILSVDRVDCETCDSCRLDADCNACGDCDACDALCKDSCSETLRFILPALDPGEVEITLYNLYGNSNGLRFTIEEPETPADTAEASN